MVPHFAVCRFLGSASLFGGASMIVQSMAMRGGLWLRTSCRGMSLVCNVTSPGRNVGKLGSRPLSSILQQRGFGINLACVPSDVVMKWMEYRMW